MEKIHMRRLITILAPCLLLTLTACSGVHDVTIVKGDKPDIWSYPAYGAGKYPPSTAPIDVVKFGDRELSNKGYVKVGRIFAKNTNDPTKIIEEARKLGGERIKYLYHDLDFSTYFEEPIEGCNSFDFGTSYGVFGKYDYMKCNKGYATRRTTNQRIQSELTAWRRDPAHVSEYRQWQAAEWTKRDPKWREAEGRNEHLLGSYLPNRIEAHGPFTLGFVKLGDYSEDVYLVDKSGQSTFITTAYAPRTTAASSNEAIAVATYHKNKNSQYPEVGDLSDIAVINAKTRKAVDLPPYLVGKQLQFSDGLLPLVIKKDDKTFQSLAGPGPLRNVDQCVYVDTNGEIAIGMKAIGGKYQLTPNIVATSGDVGCTPFRNGLALIASGWGSVQVINKTGTTVYESQQINKTNSLALIDDSGDVVTRPYIYDSDNRYYYLGYNMRSEIGFPSGSDRRLLAGKARILVETCDNTECLKGQHTWLDAQGKTLATRYWWQQCLQQKNKYTTTACEKSLYHWTDGAGRPTIDRRQMESPENLMALAALGEFELVRDSIQQGPLTANSRVANREETLLMAAAEGGNLALFMWFVQNGADVHYTGVNGNALLKACNQPLTGPIETDRIAIIKYLIAQGVSARVQDDRGRAPLIQLILNESEQLPELVDLLIRNGADINAKNQLGLTALMYAVQTEHVVAVKALLRHKPDLTIRDTQGNTLMDMTNSYTKREIVSMLKATGAPLVVGDPKADAHLLPKKSPDLLSQATTIQTTKNEGYFPLHEAARKRDKQTIKLLLQNGADPNQVNEIGIPPLVFLYTLDKSPPLDLEILQLFLDHRADINGQTNLKNNTLMAAVDRHDYAAVKYLLEHGADPNRRHEVNVEFVLPCCTALDIARKQKSTDIEQLLLQFGAQAEATR
jgi:ankyrin repeat protein